MTNNTTTTPSAVSCKIDKIINSLNINWDLRLPRLHDEDARKSENDYKQLALQCSARIRYLCFRSGEFQGAIDEFEDLARTALSKWIYKPTQEKGTIPRASGPIAESFIHRDIIATQGGKLTSQQRDKLLQILAAVLEDEFSLAQQSDVYERHSSQVSTLTTQNSSARSSSFGTAFSKHSQDCAVENSATPFQSNRPSYFHNDRKRGSMLSTNEITSKRYRGDNEGSTRNFGRSSNAKAVSLDTEPVGISRFFRRSKSAKPHLAEQGIKASFDTVTTPSSPEMFSADENIPSSNDTSIITVDQEDIQDLFPTQDAEECLQDVSFVSNLEIADASLKTVEIDWNDLAATGPFRISDTFLPQQMPYWQRFELHRLSLQLNSSPLFLYTSIEKKCQSPGPDFSQFWQAARTIFDNSSFLPPSKSEFQSWMSLNNSYNDPSEARSSYFTGKLELSDTTESFKFSLNPIKIDKSCRFHRKFGADRFMVIFLPNMTSTQLPKRFRERYEVCENMVHDKVYEWFATKDLHIVDRVWRAFYIDMDKQQNKKGHDGQILGLKLHLFAISGPGLEPISIRAFTEWHVSLKYNFDSTDLKLFSRFGLGLSKTKPTVVLEPNQFRYRHEPAPVMTDGCALLSWSLARAIWEQVGDDSSGVPAAFQGRIGGAKGLWVVDYRSHYREPERNDIWIEVSDSQLKIKPHPKTRFGSDVSVRTFELLKTSKPCTPSHLNTQLINILAERGVSRDLFREAFEKSSKDYLEAAKDALVDRKKIHSWFQKYHGGGQVVNSGSMESVEADVSLLVKSGFSAKDCPRLAESIEKLIKQELNGYIEKLRLPLEYSTTCFCIPDFYGILEPDEVHLGFSEEKENPVTKLPEMSLDGLDVLVARNPAYLSSDIQKRRAVFRKELRHFKNVILFSTKGNTPLASCLSGGDYDGDTVTVIWDPQITDAFQNAVKPELPTEKDCGLEIQATKLVNVFKKREITAQELDSFYTKCLSFNAQRNFLGICTNLHERLIYKLPSLSDPGPVLLGTLAGYLVDSSKQGYSLSHENWSKVIRQAVGKLVLSDPAYKSDKEAPKKIMVNGQYESANVLDYLKFDVAKEQKDSVLRYFAAICPMRQQPNLDKSLTRYYDKVKQRAEDKSYAQAIFWMRLLTRMKAELDDISKDWSFYFTNNRRQDSKPSEFRTVLSNFLERIRSIKPGPEDLNLFYHFTLEPDDLGSYWSLLRASTCYTMFGYRQWRMVWHLVGPELCRLKARSYGITLEIEPGLSNIVKVDTKRLKEATFT